MTSNINICIAS